MNATDWKARGVTWERINVSQQNGPHKTDTVEIGFVQSPRIVAEDMSAALEHFGPERFAGWINGSSTFDVKARSWFKARYNKDRAVKNMDEEEMRQAIYNNVMLSTGRTRIAERETKIVAGVFVRIVKSGETLDYDTLFASALDANTRANPTAPVDFIRSFVAQSLATAGIEPSEETE